MINFLKREIKELTADLDKANAHIELLTKLAGAKNEKSLEANPNPVMPVTINNNYNSNVIAVISKDSEKQQSKLNDANPAPAAINIFMGEKQQENKQIQDDRSKKLNELTAGLMEGDKEKIMDRLLQSVNMVKEVLQSNLKLREHIQELNQRMDQQNADVFHLQCENEEQKDKIQILAGMQEQRRSPNTPLKKKEEFSLAYKTTNIVGKRNNALQDSGFSMRRLNAADEILQLKRDKNMLEQRIQYLEVENIHMRTGTSHESRPIVSGTDDYEPVRSVLNEGSILPAAPITRKISNSTNRRRMKRCAKIQKNEEDSRISISKARNTCKPSRKLLLITCRYFLGKCNNRINKFK